MKTKPILITTSIVVLAVVIFLFVRGKSTGQIQKSEITQFLYGFTNRVNEGNKDSLLAYFEKDKNTKVLNRLVDLLIGKQSFGSKSSPLAHIRFNMDGCDLKIISTELATATIPVTFSHEPLDSRQLTLTLKIYKIAPHQFKIIQADARQFLTDYIAYENFVKSKTLTDKDIYSPITLEAFNTAHQLKSQYDSVIWFSHVNQKNYFYVVKGKWEGYELTSNIRGDTSRTYKMGLVGPDLKEIIPVEFDLVRNINGTFENLIEVEKGHKRGFYDLNGKNIVPVIYDQIFPINDDGNIAALRNGQNYYWLKSDYSISEKVDLKIADIVSKLKQVGSFSLTSAGSDIITEFNSRDEHGSIYLPPSYLVDLNLLPAVHFFKNPLRKNVEYEDVSTNYIVKADQRSEDDGWLPS